MAPAILPAGRKRRVEGVGWGGRVCGGVCGEVDNSAFCYRRRTARVLALICIAARANFYGICKYLVEQTILYMTAFGCRNGIFYIGAERYSRQTSHNAFLSSDHVWPMAGVWEQKEKKYPLQAHPVAQWGLVAVRWLGITTWLIACPLPASPPTLFIVIFRC